jgi:predicted N-acetyltransferase YhbS
LTERGGRTRAFVAWLKDEPVGAIEMFRGSETAGIHGLSVLDRYQGQGIGSALIEQGCRDAAESSLHICFIVGLDAIRTLQLNC